jgi:hypothetical protein
MIGAKLTDEQAEMIIGKEWATDSLFNVLKDVDGTWYISEEEVVGCNVSGLEWVNNLKLTEISPVIIKLE